MEEALWVPIFTLSAIAEDPAGVAHSRLLYACRRIVSWAEERGRPATKLAFTQAAALVSPDDTKLALEVAKLARDIGETARSESWFRHTIRLARKTDWEVYVWAYVGLGALYIRMGNIPAAVPVMLRALRTAERHRLQPLAGVAHHHLFHLSAETGRISEAYKHVHAALECYGSTHPRLPYLISDVGRFWLHIGQPDRAIPLFECAVEALLREPNELAMASANSTWAAAAGRDPILYDQFRLRTLRFIGDSRPRKHLDDAWLALAHAAILMEQWDDAYASAHEGLVIALANGNAEARFRAEELCHAARANTAMAASEIEEDHVATRQAECLAGELLKTAGSAAK